jgi:hypothetical protein
MKQKAKLICRSFDIMLKNYKSDHVKENFMLVALSSSDQALSKDPRGFSPHMVLIDTLPAQNIHNLA